ncbi:MAG: EI24 domain-containing protein [Pseudomonadota bacterium]
MTGAILRAFGRALLSQMHVRILRLSVIPFVLSVLIWVVILWLFLQPMFNGLQQFFLAHDGFKISSETLTFFGLAALKTVIVPLIAMWALLPLMILTALIFIGIAAMPWIVKHVGGRHFPTLEMHNGGTLAGSMWVAFSSFLLFALMWFLTLPLCLIPPLTFIVQPVLWGWLTARVMGYDALAAHATEEERLALLQAHRWPLFAIGTIAGAMGAIPTMLWVGGALSVAFFPFLAGVAIWLYVMVFIFTGLWFEYYCLDALAKYRVNTPVNRVPIQQL